MFVEQLEKKKIINDFPHSDRMNPMKMAFEQDLFIGNISMLSILYIARYSCSMFCFSLRFYFLVFGVWYARV